MTRKFILISVILILAYVTLISWKLWFHAHRGGGFGKQAVSSDEVAQKVYSFSFSKYTETGEKELQIEGDSADIFAQNVALINVIAKAYAE
ncbi:MAG TPA: hypothetical protein VJA00_00580, partial [Candidatus Omnitrophota bacterium]|nr:hypothetical protein [Candidatus Omnitrophota bacterium]